MKNIITLIFFLLICLSISAQDAREVKIFVPPVTGTGSAAENSFFYKQVTYEVVNQFHALVRLRFSSDFTLTGRIEPLPCSNDNSEYVFYLDLINSASNEIIGEQYLIYSVIDNRVSSMISVMVYNMLSWIPDISLEEDIRDNFLFLGGGLTWTPRIYRNGNESVYWMNFGTGVSAEFHFLDFMAASLGLQFSQDWILLSKTDNQEYRDLIMEIPIAIRFVFKPAKNYMLEPYGGISFNFSMMQTTNPSLFSWFTGVQFGIKAGTGFITIDPRFSMDILKSSLASSISPQLDYHRYMFQITLGYEIGFLKKNRNSDY